MATRGIALIIFAVLMLKDALGYLWQGDAYHALASVFISALSLLGYRWLVRRRE